MKKRSRVSFCVWGRMLISAVLLSVGAAFLMPAADGKAWGPPKREDEETFLNWYEENKNTDGAVYQLSGDLSLTKGSDEVPFSLDGQGDIRIECGSNAILIDGNVAIDNPGLKIRGEAYFVIMVRGRSILGLRQGTVEFNGQEGCAIQVMNGELTTSGEEEQFRITGQGRDVTGIQYDMTGKRELTHLDVFVEGSEKAVGIGTGLLSELAIGESHVEVTGGNQAYGILGKDTTDFLIRNSSVSAHAQDETAHVYSAYTANGGIQCENAVMEPKVENAGQIEGMITEMAARTPVYVEPGVEPGEWQLPGEINTYVQVNGSAKETTAAIPVEWDRPEAPMEPGSYLSVKGRFRLENLEGAILNPNGVKPEITVLCLPPEKMFLVGYERTDKGILLMVPYPYGADSLMLEYSTDGENFSMYTSLGDSNMLGPDLTGNGLYTFYIEVPADEGEGESVESKESVYLRFTVTGDSIFSGTSSVWKIGGDTDTAGGLPDGTKDDSGGDRGGQNTDVPDAGTDGWGSQSSGQEQSSAKGQYSRKEQSGSGKTYYGNKTGKGETEGTWGGSSTRGRAEENRKQEDVRSSADRNSEDKKKGDAGKETQEAAAVNTGSGQFDQWFVLGGVLLGIAVIAGIGIWCGKKVFRRT